MRLLQVAIAFDQLIGTIFMGCMADETMSAKLWRCHEQNVVYAATRHIVDFIALYVFFQHMHCYEAWLSEMKRKQLPKEYQQ